MTDDKKFRNNLITKIDCIFGIAAVAPISEYIWNELKLTEIYL